MKILLIVIVILFFVGCVNGIPQIPVISTQKVLSDLMATPTPTRAPYP